MGLMCCVSAQSDELIAARLHVAISPRDEEFIVFPAEGRVLDPSKNTIDLLFQQNDDPLIAAKSFCGLIYAESTRPDCVDKLMVRCAIA